MHEPRRPCFTAYDDGTWGEEPMSLVVHDEESERPPFIYVPDRSAGGFKRQPVVKEKPRLGF